MIVAGLGGIPEVFAVVGSIVFAGYLTTLLREVPQGRILNLLDGVRRGVLQGHIKAFSIWVDGGSCGACLVSPVWRYCTDPLIWLSGSWGCWRVIQGRQDSWRRRNRITVA